jgi:hypothetical protein
MTLDYLDNCVCLQCPYNFSGECPSEEINSINCKLGFIEKWVLRPRPLGLPKRVESNPKHIKLLKHESYLRRKVKRGGPTTKMKIKIGSQKVNYPFSDSDISWQCSKCKQWIRRAALYDHTYVVSESNFDEILHRNHKCVKDLTKTAGSSRKRSI